MTNRYIQESQEYEGEAVAIAEHWDQYDEHHVIVKMKEQSYVYYLDWIGGEFAKEPDEFEVEPFDNLRWTKL
jgi:hypothetical protein